MEFDSLATGNVGGYKPTPVRSTESPVPGAPTRASDSVDPQLKVRELSVSGKNTTKNAENEDQKTITISEDEIQKTIDSANKKIEPLYLEFQHRIHEKTNTLMISVINTSTKEVVREIPPEKALDALAKMWELTGILIDKKG